MTYLILVVGFVFLIKGADLFVDGAVSTANFFKIPPLIIGLTVVALGTSLPELAVGITSAHAGANEIALGNIIGANLFNFLVVIGFVALLKPLKVEKELLRKEFPFLIVGCLILVMAGIVYEFNFIVGLSLVFLLGGYLLSLISMMKKSRTLNENETVSPSLLRCLILIIMGFGGIVLGGNWVVESASEIAINLGMSPGLVGLTIVAIGTSLPELVTAIVAIKKGETQLIFGNVLGSGIFNIFLVLGISMSIYPISITLVSIRDLLVMLGVTVLVYFLSYSRRLNKGQGIALILTYLGYLIVNILSI